MLARGFGGGGLQTRERLVKVLASLQVVQLGQVVMH